MKIMDRRSTMRAVIRCAMRCGIAWLGLLLGFHAAAAPLAVTVKGIAPDGTQTTITDYRWTIEKDVTKASVPGQHATRDSYSFGMHAAICRWSPLAR